MRFSVVVVRKLRWIARQICDDVRLHVSSALENEREMDVLMRVNPEKPFDENETCRSIRRILTFNDSFHIVHLIDVKH